MLQLRTLENENQTKRSSTGRQTKSVIAGQELVTWREQVTKTVESLEQRVGSLKDKQGWQSVCH